MTGRVITFFSSKGGVGKTFVAVNAAIKIGMSGKRTLLLDFDAKGAFDLSKALSLTFKHSAFDMLAPLNAPDYLKNIDIGSFVTNYPQGNIHVLPAALDVRQVPNFTPLLVERLIEVLLKRYEFVLIDGGGQFNEASAAIFDHSNVILLVVTPDVLAIRQGEWCIDTLQSLHFPLSMVKVILNRADSKGSAPLEEVKMLLPCEIIAAIPSDGGTVGTALNKGIPVLLDNPTGRVSKVIETLGRYLIDNEQLYISFKNLSEVRAQRSDAAPEKKERTLWEALGLVESIKEVARVDLEDDEIIKLKRNVHEKLVEEMNLKRLPREAFSPDSQQARELRKKAEHIVSNILAREVGGVIASLEERNRLVKEIIEEALGLGPLEDLLKDAGVTEIMVNNKDRVYIERSGKIELSPKKFTTNDFVKVIIERIITPLGRRIDESVPFVDARLPDGSRVNAIIPPLALTGPSITIRKFAKERLTMETLIERYQSLEKNMALFLEAAVQMRRNTLVSGGTGSGKTTFLNILSNSIPERERIITIEDSAELKLHQPHWIRLESRPPNIEGKGQITIRDLFKNALRMRPDRIIVGEVRGDEVLDMLQAMNTGHDGSMSTIHANSTQDVLIRLDSMILMTGVELPIRAIREMVSSAFHLVVHTARFADGSRKVIQVTEVTGMLDDLHINLKDIFVFRQRGVDKQGKIIGVYTPTGYIPSFYDEMIAKGITLNRDIFLPTEVI